MEIPTGCCKNDNILCMPSLDYTSDPKGFGHVIFKQMTAHKDKVVQIDGMTGEKDTYSSLLQRCIRTALYMQSKGVTNEDIISICSFNHLNSCVPFFASQLIGAKIASLDPTLSLNDTAYLLKLASPKMIFVLPVALDLIEQAVAQANLDIIIVVFGDTSNYVPFSDLLEPSSGEVNFKPYETKNPHETCAIFFSSGTCGFPKGICISHFCFLGQVQIYLQTGVCLDRILTFASLYWITAALFWGATISKGTTRIIVPKFDADTVWKVVNAHKPTIMFMAPTQIIELHEIYRPEIADTHYLRDICISGGTVTKDRMQVIRNTFPNIRIHLGYGQTEISGYICHFKVNDPEEVNFLKNKPTSSGTGMHDMCLKIIDPKTEEILGPNQTGELRLKCKYQLSGYYGADSSNIWDSNGWLITGDVAYYDENKCFYVVDRIKEMLKYQSWHVPPAVIENVLLTHPDIKVAIVVGKPHEIDGDHPMAFVVLKNGKRCTTEEEIVKYVEERVHDRQRLRGGVKIVDYLPLTPSGKIKRNLVKQMIHEEKL